MTRRVAHGFSIVAGLIMALGLALVAPERAGAQGAAPGPMPVSVANPIKRQVSDVAEFTGRFEASALVEVRAQVNGQLMEVAFKDGAQVKKGDLLFKIDPRNYQNALAEAQSAVTTANARIQLTKADVDRAKDLLKTGNITDQVAQQRNQAYQEALASLQSAQATGRDRQAQPRMDRRPRADRRPDRPQDDDRRQPDRVRRELHGAHDHRGHPADLLLLRRR